MPPDELGLSCFVAFHELTGRLRNASVFTQFTEGKTAVAAIKKMPLGEQSQGPNAENYSQLTFAVESISPAEARTYLAAMVYPRKPDARIVSTYAATMKAGAWVLNGQPIIFDGAGRLLDGLQRLSACVASGVPFTSLVARGVRLDTLHTIDQHRTRMYGTVLEARGIYRHPASLVR